MQVNSPSSFDTSETFDVLKTFHHLWCKIINESNVRMVYYFLSLDLLQYYAEYPVSKEICGNQLEWTQMCHMCTINTGDIVFH